MRSLVRMTALLATIAVGCGRGAADPGEHVAGATPAPGPSLDPRTPVPLSAAMAIHQKQEMRDHLRAVQEITAALAKDDFDAIATSAARIAWSEPQAQMCKHMGTGALGFAAAGEHFHHTADGIAGAARRHDRAAVAQALGDTLATCVGCHETYRQEIVGAQPGRDADRSLTLSR